MSKVFLQTTVAVKNAGCLTENISCGLSTEPAGLCETRHMRLRIREILTAKGVSQTALADAVGVDKSHISNLVSGRKKPSLETLEKIAAVLDVEVRQLLADKKPTTTSILGRVGAGTEEILMEGQGEPIGEIELPDQLRGKGDIGAVLVEGESMRPLIEPGSVLFFRRYAADGVPSEAIGRVCVVEDADGRVWVKQVTQGSRSELFNLISINPATGARLDVPIRWAAPILLWLPPDLVRRVK